VGIGTPWLDWNSNTTIKEFSMTSATAAHGTRSSNLAF
jgi:hypothetical protein